MRMMISPSKTQKFNGRACDTYTLPLLQDKTRTLMERLKLLSRTEIAALMKTSAQLTESTAKMIKGFSQPFSLQNSDQTLFTMQGDAYKMLDSENYTIEQLLYAQNHLFILSGLYGILRPLDLMQPYRLEMGCPLAVDSTTNLYLFWREAVTDILNRDLAEKSERIIVNLASKEYSAVIDQRKLQADMVTIHFQQLHKGQRKTIPIYAKRARGLMLHYAISEQIVSAAALKAFTGDGYGYIDEESTEREWLFLQKKAS